MKTAKAEHHLSIRRPWELCLLSALVITYTALVVVGNRIQVWPWLLALLGVGVIQALLLPLNTGALGGFASLVGWVMFRQMQGIWHPTLLMQNAVEVVGLIATIGLALLCNRVWRRHQHELDKLRKLQQLVAADDTGSGVLPFKVAQLRLAEEVNRACKFGRPIGVMLVDIEQASPDLPNHELELISRAVARKLVQSATLHDTPFRLSPTRFGLILPERNEHQLYAVVEAIMSALHLARFLDRQLQSKYIREHANLAFGVGMYQGQHADKIDILRAAENSLLLYRDVGRDGPAPVASFAMLAIIAIEEAQPLALERGA